MKEVQLRVRITAETAANIAKAAKSQDVPISHLVRQALQHLYGGSDNGGRSGVPTRRAPSPKTSGGDNSPRSKGPAGLVDNPPGPHVHDWGPRSMVTALKRCKTCGMVKA